MLNKRHLPVFILLAMTAFLAGICPVLGADWKTLPGHMPSIISGLTPKGRLAATNELILAIGLPMRDPAGLDDFLKQLNDPSSPNFHQYLTPVEIAERFGPTADDYAAVKNFALTNGLTVIQSYPNRLVLDVRGPPAAVEKAFHLTLRTYRHPTEDRDFFAPDSEPAIDARLPMADVQGLSNFGRPHPHVRRVRTVARKNSPRTGSAPDGSGTYFGNDFRNAYAPGVTLTGAGQSVGLFEADGFFPSDIKAYATQAGSGRTNIIIQTNLLDSFNGIPTTGTNSGNPEVSLDIEMAMAMAPGLTKIVVYEGNPDAYMPNNILNAMLADSATVKNLSSSWGWSGGPTTTSDTIFKNMAAAGQTFFNASGDSDAFTTGASSVNGVDNTSTGNAPSSSPYITQVGGTTLTMNGAGVSYASETVWNWGGGEGSSGGISSHYGIPAWQTNVSNLAGRGGSTTQRNIPDVALTADNVFVYDTNGTNDDLGGTSCAAPLWAGFIALVNQQSVVTGRPVVGFINPAIYAIAAGTNYANCFYDTTNGNNFWSKSLKLFNATNGYDLCTGLGTPAGANLINALMPVDPLGITPLAGTATGFAGGPFTVTSGNFVLTNNSTTSLTWSLVNTSAWLVVSASSGTLTANAQTGITPRFNAATSNLVAGTYTSSLLFSNGTSHVVQPGLFTLQVSQPLRISPASGFTSIGAVGGPFNVTSQTFALTNQSGTAQAWGVSNVPSWLSVSPAGGTLAGNTQTSVLVSLTTAANSFSAGTNTASLSLTNAAGLVAVLPFTLSVGSTILNNGGFETGDFTGWTLNADGIVAGTIDDAVVSSSTFTGASSYVHAGTYGVALGESPGLGYLNQTLATFPGQNYLISLWFANPTTSGSATPNQFLVQWNGNTLFNQTNLPFTGWTNLQFIASATTPSTVLQFGFEDTPSYLGLDDVSVTPIALPSFQSVQRATTNFNLGWNATPGLKYQVQFATNLTQPVWFNLGGILTASTSTMTFQDTNAIIQSPSRFYRIVLEP